jgi:hypothetical protein
LCYFDIQIIMKYRNDQTILYNHVKVAFTVFTFICWYFKIYGDVRYKIYLICSFLSEIF